MKPVVIVATLTPAEWDVFSRPVVAKRDGGIQFLLRRLLQRANHEHRRVTVMPQDLTRVKKCAGYCEGGYEDRFRALLAAVEREQV